MGHTSQLEVLDLRHFSAAQLGPLLRDEAQRWNQRLQWDYTKSTNLLLEYLDGRVLPGYVALQNHRILGYAFCVFEGVKGVIGDVYAFNEGDGHDNPVSEKLLLHLIEMLQHTPAVDRIEAQLLMFPAGSLVRPFLSAGFRSAQRLFMMCDLQSSPLLAPARVTPPSAHLPAHLKLLPWRADFYDPAAALIHLAYQGHMDSGINDQYRTLHGSQRFLHNIIRFPGCGVFDAENSWLLHDIHTRRVEGVLLCSRVRPDTAHITQLCLNPSLRGLGLGHLMLRHCATELGRRRVTGLSLTVTEANHPARALYENNGFKTMHRFDAMIWDS